MLPLRVVKRKPFPMIPGAEGRQSIPNDASWAAHSFLRFVRTGLKTRHYGLDGSPNHLCPRDIARLIEQGIHAFEESEGVGQFRVGLECGFVHPARMNVKERRSRIERKV